MRLGLGTYAFRWSIGHKDQVPDVPMSALDVLEVAIGHGLSVVQFADNLPLHKLSNTELGALVSRARVAGVTLELGTQSFDVDQVRNYLEIGEKIGAPILRVALDGPDNEKPLEALAAEFVSLLPLARAKRIKIAVENHFDFPSDRLVALLRRIDDPQVGVCLDVANSICAGEWPAETVGRLAAHTINLHLKDYVIEPDPYGVGFRILGCPLGDGRTDCAAVLGAADYPDEMSVILEHWLPGYPDLSEARSKEAVWLARSVTYARSQLGLA
ncbi:sugar phosphate isomerase/epimerase [uncultured Roseibium sp.]|uniref:sugar phosphate isomerase/epimerase family protein n=1 Tax=uncultured Roseibium sp. TaxID=1936171 RepID=UPI00262AC1C4|nr:sugar phosphate isomerase/epimerase [uncultured Roseibium sp.]